MNARLKSGSWLTLVLIATVISPASSTYGADENMPLTQATDLSLIPDDAALFVTVRVGALADKLELKERFDKLARANDFKKQFGLPLSALDQCTLVIMSVESGDGAFILRTAEPFKQGDILKACLPGAKKVKIHGRTCQISSEKSKAICFVDKRTLVIASSEDALARCLRQAGGKRNDPALETALNQVGTSDLAVWLRTSGLPDGAADLPRGVASGLITLNAGEQLAIDVMISCTDQDGAKWATKALRTGVDTARMGLLAIPVLSDATELFPTKVDDDLKQLRALPIKLMRQAELGLQHARVKTEGTNVSLNVRISIDAKALREEISGLIRLLESESGTSISVLDAMAPSAARMSNAAKGGLIGGGMGAGLGAAAGRATGLGLILPFLAGCQTQMGGMTLPSGRYLEHYPQYFMQDPDFPLQKELQYQEQTAGMNARGLVGGGLSVAAAIETDKRPKNAQPFAAERTAMAPQALPLGPNVIKEMDRYQQPPMMPVSPAYPNQQPVLPVGAPAPPPAKPLLKLSVANVRKEAAILFTMADDGKLTFVQKVPAGDAVDVQTTAGQRWVAVFAENPATENYTVTPTERVWLLRTPPTVLFNFWGGYFN